MNRDKLAGAAVTVVGTLAVLGAAYGLALAYAPTEGSDGASPENEGDLPESVRQAVRGEILEWEREPGGRYELTVRQADGTVRERYVDAPDAPAQSPEDD